MWHDKIAAEFAIKGAGFDIAMWDSQSLAEFAGGGHAYSMNDVFKGFKVLKPELFEKFSLAAYGEYPDNSGKYWGLPVNQDAYGFMYRKDLFDDPKEKEAFKAKLWQGTQSPANVIRMPKQVAEFFTRPDKELLELVGQMGGRQYYFATTASNSFLWSFGGEKLWNPATNEVKGYLNSPASIDGVQAYVYMFKYGPPGSQNWGWTRSTRPSSRASSPWRCSGTISTVRDWEPKVNQFADRTKFGVLPGAIGRDGKFRRHPWWVVKVGTLYDNSKKIPTVIKFMEWYFQPEQQKRYAKVCQTGLKSVLDTPDWQSLNSYNKSFARALSYVNDYWHLPEYPELLDILQEEISAASSGKKTVKQALDFAAERHEALLQKAGYKITRTANIPEVPDQIVNPVGKDKVQEESYD